MRRLSGLLVLVLATAILGGCSESSLSTNEYLSDARQIHYFTEWEDDDLIASGESLCSYATWKQGESGSAPVGFSNALASLTDIGVSFSESLKMVELSFGAFCPHSLDDISLATLNEELGYGDLSFIPGLANLPSEKKVVVLSQVCGLMQGSADQGVSKVTALELYYSTMSTTGMTHSDADEVLNASVNTMCTNLSGTYGSR